MERLPGDGSACVPVFNVCYLSVSLDVEEMSLDTIMVELDGRECAVVNMTVERDMSGRFKGTPLVVTHLEEDGNIKRKLQVTCLIPFQSIRVDEQPQCI